MDSSFFRNRKKTDWQTGVTSVSEIKIIETANQTGRDEYCSVRQSKQSDLNTAKQSGTATGTASQRAFRGSVPESPIGDLIERALEDVPTLPKQYDVNDRTVEGKKASFDQKTTKINRFMLERLKKQSILNHPVFAKKGFTKEQVLEKLLNFKSIMSGKKTKAEMIAELIRGSAS